jgi:hypothetical protein
VNDDPQDYIYVERLVHRPPRRSRRHLFLADTDWRSLAQQELTATITINGVAFEIRLTLAAGVNKGDLDVEGRAYCVAGIVPVRR